MIAKVVYDNLNYSWGSECLAFAIIELEIKMDFVVDLTTTQNNKGITTIVTYQSILCLKQCLSLSPEYFQRVTHQNCHILKANLPPEERQRQNNNTYYEIRVVAKLIELLIIILIFENIVITINKKNYASLYLK